MRKIYIFLSAILMFTVLLVLRDSSFKSNGDNALIKNEIAMANHIEMETMMINRREISDLRAIEPLSKKTYAELLVDEIPHYEAYIQNFEAAKKYPLDYVLSESKVYEETISANIIQMDAIYISDSTEEKISLKVLTHCSAHDAQKEWLRVVYEGYTIPHLPHLMQTGLSLGTSP